MTMRVGLVAMFDIGHLSVCVVAVLCGWGRLAGRAGFEQPAPAEGRDYLGVVWPGGAGLPGVPLTD